MSILVHKSMCKNFYRIIFMCKWLIDVQTQPTIWQFFQPRFSRNGVWQCMQRLDLLHSASFWAEMPIWSISKPLIWITFSQVGHIQCVHLGFCLNYASAMEYGTHARTHHLKKVQLADNEKIWLTGWQDFDKFWFCGTGTVLPSCVLPCAALGWLGVAVPLRLNCVKFLAAIYKAVCKLLLWTLSWLLTNVVL